MNGGSQLPPLLHVPLIIKDGIEVHDYETLLKHLEQQYDPQIKSKVLLFILTGSRLYQSSHENSDWDYLCILSEKPIESRPSKAAIFGAENAPQRIHISQNSGMVYDIEATLELYNLPTTNIPRTLAFDVHFYGIEDWKKMGHEQYLSVFEAQITPQPFILYSTSNFPKFTIDPPVFKSTNCLLAGLKFSNARPRINTGNIEKAKKLAALAYRYLLFSYQILKSWNKLTGEFQIEDWGATAPLYLNEILPLKFTTFDEYETALRPRFKELETQVRQAILYDTLYTERERESTRWNQIKYTFTNIPEGLRHISPNTTFEPINSEFITTEYILYELRTKGFGYIAKYYGLLATFNENLVSLILGYSSPFYYHPSFQKLHGCILDISINSFPVVAWGVGKILDMGISVVKPELVKLPTWFESEIIIEEWLDGTGILLFFYNGKWNISTHGGDVNAREKIAFRPSENCGPSKSTLAARFEHFLEKIDISLLDTSKSYLFEIITPYWRHICITNEETIVLLDIFNKQGESCLESSVIHPSWTRTKKLQILDQMIFEDKFKKLEFLKNYVNDLNPFICGGLVIRSPKNGERFKIVGSSFSSIRCSIGYQNYTLAFNVPGSNFETDSIREVVLTRHDLEFLSHYPKYKEKIQHEIELLIRVTTWITDLYRSYRDNSNSKKDFAIAAKSAPPQVKTILLDWYNYDVISAWDILAACDIKTLKGIYEAYEKKIVVINK